MHVPFAEPNAMSTNISRLIPSVTNTSIHKGNQQGAHDIFVPRCQVSAQPKRTKRENKDE
jgi:hypothetical protein